MSRNSTLYTTSVETGIKDHPMGITTATKCFKNDPLSTAKSVVSLYNIDFLGNAPGYVRSVGAWVWVSAPGHQGYLMSSGSGSIGPKTTLQEKTWTWITAPGLNLDGFAGAYIDTIEGPSSVDDYGYVTGVVALEGTEVPPYYFDGSSMETRDRFYKWNGMVNGSASSEYFVDGSGEGISPGQSLANLKERLMTIVLGPNPVRVSEKSLADIKKEALEKLLGDNGLI